MLDLVSVLDLGALTINFWEFVLKLYCWFYGLMVLQLVLQHSRVWKNSKFLGQILKMIVNRTSQIYYPINKVPICLLVDVIGSKNVTLKNCQVKKLKKLSAQKNGHFTQVKKCTNLLI